MDLIKKEKMKQPVESEYKDWTDYAEAKLAWQDEQAEFLKEKIDFLEGGYNARHRRVTHMLNERKTPTSWQLSHCSIDYLVDAIQNQLNNVKALKEMREADQDSIKHLEGIVLATNLNSQDLQKKIDENSWQSPPPTPKAEGCDP